MALYVFNGLLIGWVDAHEVPLGETSPAVVHPQWCARPLSLTGWTVIGAAAGYVITEQIHAHHAREPDDVLDEPRHLAEPPPPASGSGG
ncbi:hypothetical protein [Streptomyces longispororuber]|uniref:hypothetical protein n=1 Tax=Streptomyces longispororuber TaxID=68230 RepID=UPI0036FBB45B